MFIIAGISPKIKTIESTPRICSVCGLAQAYLKRIDHYLTLFFIPIIRVKKGDPVLICERCEKNVPDIRKGNQLQTSGETMCRFCGRTIEKDFRYCPHCGKSIDFHP